MNLISSHHFSITLSLMLLSIIEMNVYLERKNLILYWHGETSAHHAESER